jgi:hypothetical protein
VWYQGDVRTLAMFAGAALATAGCAGPPHPSPSVTSVAPATARHLDPVRIDRARGALPAGYEVVGVGDRIAPFAQWGLTANWTADPPHCAVLADPGVDPGTAKGWSASGPGGIVYAVVVRSSGPVGPDLVDACAQWTLVSGHTEASVTTTDGPAIDGAVTIALSTAATTVVEGGTETHSHADTVTAYDDGYAVIVTVVTDPGSPNPQLGQDFAPTLLVESVAELRR